MIRAIGIDIVEVKRIDDIIERWDDSFVKRIYSQEEIDYCYRKVRASMHFAARFAAKEAFVKCLGRELGNGVALRHITVINEQDGTPRLKLQQELADRLAECGLMTFHLSISHTENYATAVVILEDNIK